MLAGLRVGWRGYRHALGGGYVYIWGSVMWFALSLLLVTMPAAWAGLCLMSYHAYRTPTSRFEDILAGFRAHWRGSLLIGIGNIIIVTMTLVNLISVINDPSLGAMILRLLWLFSLCVWFGLQLYAFPLLGALKTPTLRGGYRNAAVMALQNPFFTFGVWLSTLPVLIITLIFPFALALVTPGVLASIGNAAVQDRLVAAGFQQSTPEPPPDTGAGMIDEVYS